MDNKIEQLYNYLHNLHCLDHTSQLYDINKNALQKIKHYGFPSKNDEKWKYVNIQKYINKVLSDTKSDNTNQNITVDPTFNTKNTIIFSDGLINFDAYNNIKGIDISIGSTHNQSDIVNEDFINTLNNASIHNVINISISETLLEPIYLIHTFTNAAKLNSYKISIDISEGNTAFVNEIFMSSDEINKIISYDLLLNIQAKAKINSYRFNQIQSGAVFLSNTDCIINTESVFNNINICAAKADLVKNHINCHLNNEHASVDLYGLNMLNEQTTVDNQTAVFHNISNCRSNELYKYITTTGSMGVFNGKIYVAKDAQQTRAFQQNKNILLSPDSIVHAQPQLEIFANDVKCSHGCTIGQLDQESIFYLKTRGISEQEAKNILINAFTLDILGLIEDKDFALYLNKHLNLY